MRRVPIRTLAIWATLLVMCLAAVRFALHQQLAVLTGLNPHHLWLAFNMLAWAAGAVLAARLVEALLWSQVGRKSGRYAPQLLVQITNVVIYLAAATGMAGVLFEIPLTGAIATSSVIGLVLGFALKSLISDTFSGIALNLDQGFGINDYVEIVGDGVDFSGRVTQINWRSTFIHTPENLTLVVPNSVVSESIVLNYSKPGVISEFHLLVTLDFEIPGERGLRVLQAAAHAAAREDGAIHDCRVRIDGVSSDGITYRIKYLLDPDRLGPSKAKSLILGHVERQMKMTGLSIAHPKLDNWQRATPEMSYSLGDLSNRLWLLRKVQLFKGFEEDELAGLAERMTLRHFPQGTNVITVDEPGELMFVLSEGLTSVRAKGQDGEFEVAALSPGDFFGEMSLLTGEPRSASIVALTDTVAFEIHKEDLLPLLDSNREAAAMLSTAAAERRLATASGSARSRKAVEADKASLSSRILKSMMRFFGLSDRPSEMERA